MLMAKPALKWSLSPGSRQAAATLASAMIHFFFDDFGGSETGPLGCSG